MNEIKTSEDTCGTNVEPIHLTYYHFGITIKATYGPYMLKCESDESYLFDYFITFLQRIKCDLKIYCTERDTRNIPHIHAYIVTTQKLCYRELQEMGWHIYVRQLFSLKDRESWIAYVKKPEYKPGDYLFIDNE